jgi:sigma-B regulation protein RsbU (phosphoserine phosphatase)
VVVSSGRDTTRFRSNEIGVTGQAIVHGVTYAAGRWRVGEFALTARASFTATLSGLFANVRENFLSALPLAALVGLALLLIPIGLTDMNMVRGMGGSITRGIAALRDGAQAFGAGKLEHRIPIEGDDDLWDTARQFNQMAEGLERARELEKERDRLEHELDLARLIQARLLPAHPPRIAGLDVAGLSESAREVGGDYYDHIDLGGGRLLLVVADVSGKGVPAALLMSGFRASLMSQDTTRGEPAAMAARLNDFLVKSVESGKFVTAFLGFLDAATGKFVYVNAGHNPTVLVRRSGATELLTQGGLILGIMADSPFAAGETTLEPGDLVALYTDGVTEGANAAQEQWGEERLIAALQAGAHEPAATIASRIVREVRAFEGDSGPADDITVLVARRTS